MHAFTLSNTNISATSQPIAIKFYLTHDWGGEKIAFGFRPGRIRTLVFMATYSSHRFTMRKTENSSPKQTTHGVNEGM